MAKLEGQINRRRSLTGYCHMQNALDWGNVNLIQSQAYVPAGRTCSRAGSSPQATAPSGHIHLLLHALPAGRRGISAPAAAAPPLLPPPLTRGVHRALSFLTPHCQAAFCHFLNTPSQSCHRHGWLAQSRPRPGDTVELVGTGQHRAAPTSPHSSPGCQRPDTHTFLVQIFDTSPNNIRKKFIAGATAVCLVTPSSQSHSHKMRELVLFREG